MAQIKVEVIIETDDVESTTKAVMNYLQETLEQGFLDENENVVSIDVVEEAE